MCANINAEILRQIFSAYILKFIERHFGNDVLSLQDTDKKMATTVMFIHEVARTRKWLSKVGFR